MMIGGKQADRSQPAWRQVYRALDHSQCKEVWKNKAILKKFPQDIQDFLNKLVQLQEKRYDADYDPIRSFYKSEVEQDCLDAELAIKQFNKVPKKDQRAFAAWVLFKRR
ncbi:MAG TPA: hypothetical protein VFR34_12205 [Paracoccaceae bacterium]|nr:hypothetical protein [Paracoccaceae bacterium]